MRSQLSDAASERDRLRDALSHSSSEEASRQLAHEAQLQADKEARIELLRKRTARRLLNQELVRGWGAWYELWSVRAERRRLMARAVSILAPNPRPSLTRPSPLSLASPTLTLTATPVSEPLPEASPTLALTPSPHPIIEPPPGGHCS